eukprot:4672627-Amphidinium_carterae.2
MAGHAMRGKAPKRVQLMGTASLHRLGICIGRFSRMFGYTTNVLREAEPRCRPFEFQPWQNVGGLTV